MHNVFHTRQDTAILRHMDEIIIEEKKYISSKRAAKMTGYAKDYVGQLCREGRVSARLVGRSWYVLETAIQDHRFGDKRIESDEVKVLNQEYVAQIAPESSSHYESSPVEILPSINRLQDDAVLSSGKEERSEFSQRLQDSWSAWFDHVKDIEIEDVKPVDSEEVQEESKNDEKEEGVVEMEEDVSVPIRVHRGLPKELLPNHRLTTKELEREEVRIFRVSGNKPVLIIQMIGSLFAVIFVALAVIGSGYIDRYITLLSQVSIISGVIMYNK